MAERSIGRRRATRRRSIEAGRSRPRGESSMILAGTEFWRTTA
jgi:hypothetical protein